ncbi:FecCD family ABC transporter permease [Domibacillus robiginosus]|uniref:FecCD family ABC transporter permease n=1 Tax=Domibacillus robiginosus TaxID=1071054 RepID=UPI00067ACB9D|nr:iron ABC transporter permease [Domibacillus robiginosus]
MKYSQKRSQRTSKIAAVLLLCLALTFLISLNTGLIQIAPIDVFRLLIGSGSEQNAVILFDFRLPRMVIALLIGAGIGISGAILQGISRNELADPGILGINAGAGFAVILFIFYFQGNAASAGAAIWVLPLFAMLGALLAGACTYLFAWKGGVSPTRLVLSGIGVNAAFAALIIVFQLKMDPKNFSQAIVWLSGSIWGTNWAYVLAVFPWILILIPYTIYKSRYLNVLYLGDELAKALGVRIEKERRKLLITSVLLAGTCVAVGGGIAFLGLVAPHLARRLAGPRHEHFLPVTALIGALLLLAADVIGRVILMPTEVPVGLVVSALGAPYFIYLLIKMD